VSERAGMSARDRSRERPNRHGGPNEQEQEQEQEQEGVLTAHAPWYPTTMILPERFVICCARVVTCDPMRETPDNALGAIANGAVYVEDGVIECVGPRAVVIEAAAGAPVVYDGPCVMTPGLVDAHTHAVWAGSRHDEYAVRMAGGDYEAIAAAGGGIVSTMRAVRACSEQELVQQGAARLLRMAALGTTTCEIKSGYGLDLDNELKQLQAIAALSRDRSMPRVIPTYLALHAIPPEARDQRKAWVARVAEQWVPAVAERKLARYVDAYVDRAAFTVEEARLVFGKAHELGLGVRAHVGQFADVGGAELAADGGAASVDHLEHVSHDALVKLSASGTRAVLLPVASHTLRQQPPPVAAIMAAGVKIVIATDSNPGTAPTESLPLAMGLAVRDYGLTPEEAIVAATREAAHSLGLEDVCGRLSSGLDADLVVWELPHERAIVQPWGSCITRLVVSRGQALYAAG
jgi:imidazolonepropionase